MIPMRACDVLCNLKNWTSWDYKAYKLQENEAAPVMKALDNYIWHDVETEGMPKDEGWYLFRTIDQYSTVYYKTGYYTDKFDLPDITHWRKIIEEE